MQELLEVIYQADLIIDNLSAQCEKEKAELIESVVLELSKIDQLIDRHFETSDL